MDKATGRIRRGQTSGEFDSMYAMLSDADLIVRLASASAQERTSVARILGVRRCEKAVSFLCDGLSKEEALYARMSMSEALGEIGEASVPHLVSLLGKIGKNQYKALPTKGFYKKNYPLPRDIAARTVVKVGVPAISYLEKVILEGERESVLEAVDAIGYISFYEKVLSSASVLLAMYQACDDDLLLKWKLLRAFQAFPLKEIVTVLEGVIGKSAYPALRWEAVRSLGQQPRRVNPQVVATASIDSHVEVRRMTKLFLKSND